MIKLNYGEAFCTVVFFKNLKPSTKPCGKEPSRLDIFIKEWTKTNKKAKQKEKILKFIYIMIIPVSFVIGYSLFKNNPGIIATSVIGIAISQVLLSFKR